MTTVVGLGRGGRVWMAADSLVSVCDRPLPGSVRKILRVPVGGDGGDALVGVAGDGALAGLVRQFVRLDEVPELTDEGLTGFADGFAVTVSALARDHGVLDDGRMAGMVLLGYAGRVWTVVHAQAIAHPDGLEAVGSGADAALGAMDVLLEGEHDPGAALMVAVQVAIGRDVNSGPPVQLEVAKVGDGGG